ncbi:MULTISPECIES: hypothetical protein [Burkholderia cepacia complex]|uniref:hypothetical protein n=1 Tax=Burkholderia cepacia complex TaxID=87882 RepID=UPI00064BF061|nr:MULTISPECIES: hypothetical protein [Burkholderia cepacia complex]AKM05038.1 hypothetical protein ABD05_33090 [Burkholderia pyrrocinia]
MTIQSAIVRAAALAAVLYAMNRLKERRNAGDIMAKSTNVTTGRVAGIVTGLIIFALIAYSERHLIAASFG